jgi:hypothetical protein
MVWYPAFDPLLDSHEKFSHHQFYQRYQQNVTSISLARTAMENANRTMGVGKKENVFII